MRILVDLLWVRHGISGGTESVIRNLMHGFGQFASEHEFIYLVAEDNAHTFENYKQYKNFKFYMCNTSSSNRLKRVIWQRINIRLIVKKLKVDVFFSPVYCVPGKLSVPIVAVIHDLQAMHYPEYFSKFRNIYMYWSWKETCKIADRVITISDFCRKDIISKIGIKDDRIEVIYNPVIPSKKRVPFEVVGEKFGIVEFNYYYTVSSLAKHKNLITLLKAFDIIHTEDMTKKLVITGIKVNASNEIMEYVKAKNLEEHVIFTGFITDEERDALYRGAKAFLYPSIFEGFGMPPIEAMQFGVPTIVSDATCLKEVTKGKAIYIDNPLNADEWATTIANGYSIHPVLFPEYGLERITEKYISSFVSVV